VRQPGPPAMPRSQAARWALQAAAPPCLPCCKGSLNEELPCCGDAWFSVCCKQPYHWTPARGRSPTTQTTTTRPAPCPSPGSTLTSARTTTLGSVGSRALAIQAHRLPVPPVPTLVGKGCRAAPRAAHLHLIVTREICFCSVVLMMPLLQVSSPQASTPAPKTCTSRRPRHLPPRRPRLLVGHLLGLGCLPACLPACLLSLPGVCLCGRTQSVHPYGRVVCSSIHATDRGWPGFVSLQAPYRQILTCATAPRTSPAGAGWAAQPATSLTPRLTHTPTTRPHARQMEAG
jgi:hypothetical protein